MAAQRCYSCGEWDVIVVHHGHTDEEDCTERCHSYCRNCDYGTCPECNGAEPCERGTIGCAADHSGADTECETY